MKVVLNDVESGSFARVSVEPYSWDMERGGFRVKRFFAVLTVLLAACSGDSCGCDAYEQRAFPADKLSSTIPAVGQVRITASGLDYVESQVPYILEQALPGGLNFCIPRDTSGNPDICVDSTCASGANGCQVGLELVDQSINPMGPDMLEVEVAIGDVNERLNFDYDAGLFTVNCYVQVFKNGSSESTPATVMGTVPVRVFTDSASDTNEVGVEVGQASLNLEDVDFKIHGRGNVGDTVLCEGASLIRGFFRGRIEDEIQGALDGAVAGIERDQLCRQCGGDDDCPGTASCNAGVCEYATSCVPRTLGIEGRLELTMPEIVGDLRARSTPRADFLGKAADLARVDTGVTVGLRAGAEPVAISDCVPVDPNSRPTIPNIPASDAITGDSRPGGGSFMFGAGVHKSAIEQALWSVWASGATCIIVGTADLEMINSTAFSLAAPSLKDIIRGGQPVQIAFVANKPPRVTLGQNTVTQMGDTYEIDDPLLTVNWDDLDLHVFGWAQDRMLRLLTLRIDFALPIAMAYDGTQLVPLVTDIESAIANVEVRRSELAAEPQEQILDAVPTFLAIAGPFLDYGLPDGIVLPEFLGFRLDIDQEDITSVDNGEFLAVYASLARTNLPYTAVANTAIFAQEVSYDRVLPSGFVRPEVTLDVHGYASNPFESDGEYEFSWRVDGGLWSLYRRSTKLVINDPILAVHGEHTIEVRARKVGEMRTADPTPAFEIIDIAWDNPKMQITPADPTDDLEPEAVPVVRNTAPRPVSKGMKVTGCSAANGTASPWLLVVALLFFRRRPSRRRTARSCMMLLVVLFLGSGCYKGCKGEVKTNADEFCLGADCVVDQACQMDGDCSGICPEGAGGICEDGKCQCVIACEPGCADDAFCCLSSKECVSYGNLCDGEGLSCEPGYEPGVTEAIPDRDNCELMDFQCDCVPLPPIAVGWHGRHTSIDSDGGLTVVGTYNDTYEDLMLGVVQDDATVAWHTVEGVPTGETIVGDPNGPRGGIDAKGDDVGTHSAVAIADGRVHVFYRDEDNDVLKWGVATFGADGPPQWESAVLDDTPGAGHWTTAVASGTEVHVAYALLDDPGSELRHVAVEASASPSPVTATTILTDATEWDGKGKPLVVAAMLDLSEADGTPFLVFYNGIDDRVGRTQFDGTSWADPSYVASGNGPWAAGALGSDGNEHVVFQQSGGLRYSRFGDTATSEVDDGYRIFADEYWTGTVGEDATLRIDSDLTVAYQDAFDRTLIVANSPDGASGSWTLTRHPLDGTASGFWIALTRRGERYVADMVIDRSNEDMPAYVRVTEY